MALLSPFIFYQGFCQPYQLNTFGDRYFDKRTLALELIAFYASEVPHQLPHPLIEPHHHTPWPLPNADGLPLMASAPIFGSLLVPGTW